MAGEPNAALRNQIINTIRFLAVDAVERAKSGHPGTPMALAGPAFELWDQYLRFDPTDPNWPLRDRFVLSAGHASMLQYALLHLFGYELSLTDLQNFRQLGAPTAGHPEYGHAPGVEVTTGPLGQGFAHSVGMALAAKLTAARFARDGEGPGLHTVYGIASDGDLMEGISSEAGSLAGHWRLGNLIYLYDDNRITIDGTTDLSFSEDVRMRFEAQRWHVEEVAEEDVAGLRAALDRARGETDRPSLLICRTTIGIGSPNKAGSSKAHGAPLGADEVALTKEALGWPTEPEFHVPDEVRAYFATRIEAKRAERAAADERLAAWRAANTDAAKEWDDFLAKRVPSDLAAKLTEGIENAEAATRKHSNEVIQRLGDVAPFVVGGSADLAESNLTRIKTGGDVGPAAGSDDPFLGRNIHYGIREHSMGAITNGIALDGTFLPFSGTFLIFSDYMRPAIRLAALMGVRSTFVFTHDSIFLGEDGPTHQPIEHLDALRGIPGLVVFRPADAIETAMAWAYAVERSEGPSLLALTRQGLPALNRPAGFTNEDVLRGAYTVREPDGAPQVVLVATGSEVALSIDAANKLTADGVQARVVSLPSLELFEQQSADYRAKLLPTGVPVVAVEAARGVSLQSLAGDTGYVHGIDRFGASAPAGALAETYGFTPDGLANRVREHLRKG